MRIVKILTVAILVSVVFAVIWKLNIFSIDKVIVSSNVDCVSEQNIKDGLKLSGNNLLTLDQNKIKNELSVKYLCIKDIDISYEFPRNLKITVYGRKFLTKVISIPQINSLSDLESSVSSETALLDWNFSPVSSDEAFIADDTGFIFTKNSSSATLPTLLLKEDLTIGKQLDKKMFNSVDVIFTKIIQMEPISSMSGFIAKKEENALLVDSPVKLIFSLDRDILRQLASLQLILQKAKIDGRMAQVIDLRFNKPVIEYPPKPSK